MSDFGDATKRLLVGRPVRSDRVGLVVLRKRVALPALASDALSSVAYAPDEILLTLSLAGLSAALLTPWVGVAVAVVMVTVVASYRQTVHAYPAGGGDYQVASANLGSRAGLATGGALLVDYVLTVAVSVSAGAQYAASAIPALRGSERLVAAALVLVLVLVNLRGVRESGRMLAAPVYVFLGGIGALAVVGLVRAAAGTLPPAPTADLELVPAAGFDGGLLGLAGALLVLRAFAAGGVALTGINAISNGVPAFRPPKSRNAATTLLLLAVTSITMTLSILVLARITGVRFVEDPSHQLLRDGVPVGADVQLDPVISQLAAAVFAELEVGFLLVVAATGVILVLAANSAFNAFPILGSVLARDGFLPRQLRTRGDRLAFSNGIIALGAAAILLVWVFDATVTRLIQLYIVGVFFSFTVGQFGMVRHWTTRLRTEVDHRRRARMRRSRWINALGMTMTALVLLVILVTRFTRGAWISLVAIALAVALMWGVRSRYDAVHRELAVDDPAAERALPSRVHAVVLVSRVHKPTLRAVAYARAARPSTLEAVTVGVDAAETAELRAQWAALGVPVPLRILDSPFREITRPVLAHVAELRRRGPRDLVVVYIPEYVVGRWWERLLHNQSTLRLKARLRLLHGVVVATVPWQLESSRRRRVGPATTTGEGHPGDQAAGRAEGER